MTRAHGKAVAQLSLAEGRTQQLEERVTSSEIAGAKAASAKAKVVETTLRCRLHEANECSIEETAQRDYELQEAQTAQESEQIAENQLVEEVERMEQQQVGMQTQVDSWMQQFVSDAKLQMRSLEETLDTERSEPQHWKAEVAAVPRASPMLPPWQQRAPPPPPATPPPRVGGGMMFMDWLGNGPPSPRRHGGVDGTSIPHVSVFSVAAGDSSAESSEEGFQRRRTPVKALDLGDYPTAGGFRAWMVQMYTKCVACSNRSKKRTMRFLKQVESCTNAEELDHVSRPWEAFDNELVAAVMRLATGALKRELLMKQESLQRQGKLLSGRVALHCLYRGSILQRGQATQVDMARLLAH